MNNILYIGSGKSALLATDSKYNDYVKICVNNAWRLFQNSKFDIWIHSGDFPKENFPIIRNYNQEISFNEYHESARKAAEYLKWKTTSPDHYLGYTIFFLGLYWIMIELKPKTIGTLGFDHDYNPKSIEKFLKYKEPGIQNNFHGKKEKTIKDWSNTFFEGIEPSHFYGHGTPDPMRESLGKNHLIEKFKLAIESANKLNIKLYNYSKSNSEINIFEKC